jgi:MoaA/NifB/PqqE/SkfB family radical SAM enzyme
MTGRPVLPVPPDRDPARGRDGGPITRDRLPVRALVGAPEGAADGVFTGPVAADAWAPYRRRAVVAEGRVVTPDRSTGEGGAANQPFNPARDLRKNVEINIGKACNNRCVFCVDGLPKAEDRTYLPYDAMRAEIDRWYAVGHRSLGFLGGEPTTYPQIVQAVAYARKVGFTRVTIATNATKLRLEPFADRLLEAGLTRITVSMHGHTAELEDRLTRVPGNFEKKCTALRYLSRKRQQGYLVDGLSINIVVNGWNYQHLPRMLRFFYEGMGLDDVRANYIRPEGWSEGSAELTPPLPRVVPYLMKAILLNEFHFKKTFTFGGFPMCVLPAELVRSERLLRKYMGEYRDLSTDCSIRGDADTDGVVKVEEGRARFNWQDRKRFDLKGHPTACDTCELEPVCEGVWRGYLEIYGDSEFRAMRR